MLHPETAPVTGRVPIPVTVCSPQTVVYEPNILWILAAFGNRKMKDFGEPR